MPPKKQLHAFNNLKLLFSVLIIGALVIGILQWTNSRRIKFSHYSAFGIDMPIEYKIHGIDVSRYQKEIGWKDVKAMNIDGIAINFVFIKATEGYNLTDKYFKYNWKTSKKLGISRGAYHFFNPAQKSAAQAINFISRVKLLPGDLPPVLDVEQIGNIDPDVFKTGLKNWLGLVEKYYKVKPIIYTNADFYKKYLGDDFNDYPLWIAHYYEKKEPRVARDWTFWQHNDRGNVSGINAFVDFNVFNGDSTAFANLLIR